MGTDVDMLLSLGRTVMRRGSVRLDVGNIGVCKLVIQREFGVGMLVNRTVFILVVQVKIIHALLYLERE